MKLKSITLSDFRGATQLTTISFGEEPISLIFGENGTGKSTIIDAFDLVCNEKIGSLADYSMGTRSIEKYIPSLK
jgi:predicted ATP-binding protein involved in virulence